MASSPAPSDDFLFVGLTPRPVSGLPSEAGSPGESEFSFSVSGGGAKRALLFVPAACTERYCLGFVGVTSGNKSQVKFCLKLCEEDEKGCGVASHEVNKFSLEDNAFYIRATANHGLCNPVIRADGLSGPMLDECQKSKKTVGEWLAMFEKTKDSTPDPMDLVIDTKSEIEVNEPPLESPVLVESTVFGLFPTLPILSIDDHAWESLVQEQLNTFDDDANASAARLTNVMYSQFRTVKKECESAFSEMEGGFSLLVKDLKNLQTRLETFVGDPKPLEGAGGSSIWKNITFLQSHLSAEWEIFRNEVKSWMASKDRAIPKPVSDKLLDLQDSVSSITTQLKQHAKRFDHLRPFMEEVRVLQEDVRDMDIAAVSRSLRQLSTRIQTLEENSWSVPTPAVAPVKERLPLDDSLELVALVGTMQEQIKLLEKRVVGKGVSIGTLTLQSFEDCMTWVTAHIPPDRWGLFVDGVSLFEFMDVQHTDVHDALQAIHNSKKSGFASLFESRVAVSMSNLLPTLFGKSAADGYDTSEFLPALQNPDKWDLNGVTGLKHNLERGMVNVTTFLETSINRVFRTHDKARQLALECLMRSKRFIQELINFMTNEFSVWKHRGYSKLDAWRITCICVRRVFEALYAVRVTARDMPETTDKHFVAASILWSTIAAHEVMEDYTKLQFLEHPTISAVISRHLAAHHVKVDDQAGSKIKKCEEQLRNMQSKIDKLESTIKQLQDGKKQGKKGRESPGADQA